MATKKKTRAVKKTAKKAVKKSTAPVKYNAEQITGLYDSIDISILKAIPNPSNGAYEIKVKIPEFTFLGVRRQTGFCSDLSHFLSIKEDHRTQVSEGICLPVTKHSRFI